MTSLKILFAISLAFALQACGGDTAVVAEDPVVTVSATTASANSQRFAIAQDTALSINLEGQGGASFNFIITTQPVNGVLLGMLSGVNPTLMYTPNNGFVGDDSFAFEVTDDEGNVATGTVTIQVVSQEDANKDSDSDGLTDLDELNKYGTSPILSDTDADGFSDHKEVITFGFDASVNNLRFNPLIADIPQIDVQLTSAPVISLNYTTTEGVSSSVSTNRSQSSSQAVTSSETLEQTTSFEHSHTFGVQVAVLAGVEIGATSGAKSSVTATVSYSGTVAFGEENTQSWTEEQTQENSTALEQGESFEESNEVSTSGGGLAIAVQVNNGGNISYTLNNLFLSAVYLDLSLPDPVIPIGNLAFDNAGGFPSFTLAPNEASGQLNFVTSDLSIDTTKSLLANSQGLIIRPAVFDMLDENGVSYTFNNTAMQAQNALVVVDFAGLNGLSTLRLMIATNAKPNAPGISIADVLQNVLRLETNTDSTDGFLTDVAGVSNNEPAGRWVMLHGAQSGNDNMTTTVYTTPSDKSRVQSVNSNVNNIVSSYDLAQIIIRGGDILHLAYLLDDDQDTISNRAELVYGTNPNNADTDGDGLDDGAEINGWQVSYLEKSGSAVIKTVTSNPLLSDTDADGLSDLAEANILTADSRLKRNPQSKDTDGDGLGDFIDDLTGTDFAPNVYDDLDIASLSAVLSNPASVPTNINITYEVLDVTEAGVGVAGNGINDYRIHIYRHITDNATGSHPEPLSAPLNFAPVILGQTLTCGTACNWTLVEISASIPGALNTTFVDPVQITTGSRHKYIAYLQINGSYVRSKKAVFASADLERVTIHVLPGDGTNNTALTNVRTVTDFRTLLSDPAKKIEYSAEYNEIFISEGFAFISTVDGHFRNAAYGSVYDGTTLVKKSVAEYQDSTDRVTVTYPERFFYSDCPATESVPRRVEANCWLERFARPSNIHGYVTDAVDANDVGNVLSHPLGAGDGAFTLDWSMKFGDSVIIPRPGLASNQLRYICGSYRDRVRAPADFSDDLMYETLASLPTKYVRRPSPLESSCAEIDVFVDTFTDANGDGVYTINPVTGGATFSRNLPAQARCYPITFIAYEYNENKTLDGGFYNRVAYPYSGEANFANTDEAELCRDDAGIWTLNAIQLRTEHEAAIISVLATTANNPNFINYTTRPLVWDDSGEPGRLRRDGPVRTTVEGTLRVNYLIEVTK